MKIDDVIEKLQRIKQQEGNIDVTCTAALLPDGYGSNSSKHFEDIFESTVENFIVTDKVTGNLKKRVRIYF